MYLVIDGGWGLIIYFHAVVSGSEEGAAQTYEGAPLLHRYLPVVAHAHRELSELWPVGEIFCLEVAEDGVEIAELGAHLLFVVGVGGHAHHAYDAHVRQFAIVLHQLVGFGSVEAELGFFGGYVELQQTIDLAVVLGGLLVDGLQERERVDAVDERDEGDDVLYLVGLEVSDEVPLDVVGQLGVLVTHLECFVLAEETLSDTIGVLYHRSGLGLGDSHEAHPVGDERSDGFNVFYYVGHDEID